MSLTLPLPHDNFMEKGNLILSIHSRTTSCQMPLLSLTNTQRNNPIHNSKPIANTNDLTIKKPNKTSPKVYTLPQTTHTEEN